MARVPGEERTRHNAVRREALGKEKLLGEFICTHVRDNDLLKILLKRKIDEELTKEEFERRCRVSKNQRGTVEALIIDNPSGLPHVITLGLIKKITTSSGPYWEWESANDTIS